MSFIGLPLLVVQDIIIMLISFLPFPGFVSGLGTTAFQEEQG